MEVKKFNSLVEEQLKICKDILIDKGFEYAPDAIESAKIDRLEHFKKASVIMNCTPKEALLGMLVKHLVSISNMCTDQHTYSKEKWTEKITDSINYLLLLKALVEEDDANE